MTKKMEIVTVGSLEEEDEDRYIVLADDERFRIAGHGPVPGAMVVPGQRCVLARKLVWGGMVMCHSKRNITREIRPVDSLAFKGALDPESIFLNGNYVDVCGTDIRVTKEHGVSYLGFRYDGGYHTAKIEIPDFKPRKFPGCTIRVFGRNLRTDEEWKQGSVHGAVLRGKNPECIFYEPLEKWPDSEGDN
jgi:hypothetical protein